MKVSINIKKIHLQELIYALQNEVEPITSTTISDKTYKHLLVDTMKQLLRKQISRSDNYCIKPFKMSFSYPQAAALWHYSSKVETNNDYRDSVCRHVQLQIHKQLV